MTNEPRETEDYCEFHSADWRGLVLFDWNPRFAGCDPLGWLRRYENKVSRLRPGGCTWRVRSEWGTVFVKHVSARYTTRSEGGWRLGKRLRWLLRRSPALRLVRVARQMQARGIGSPRVLLAVRRGGALTREDLVITEAVHGRRLLVLATRKPDAAKQLLCMMADETRKMHDAGVAHGHLLAGHMLIPEGQERVVFIDNDENRFYRRPAPWHARERNLSQLAHQVSPIYRLWRPFFHHYFEQSGLPKRLWRHRLARILRRARARARASGRSRAERARFIQGRVAEWIRRQDARAAGGQRHA